MMPPSKEDDLPQTGNIDQDGLALNELEGVMAWFYLVCAGVLEIVWAFSMKQSQGFSRLLPSVVTLVAMVISFWLLSIAMRSIPLGTAYTIWTGIGAIGAFCVGVIVLSEPIGGL